MSKKVGDKSVKSFYGHVQTPKVKRISVSFAHFRMRFLVNIINGASYFDHNVNMI